MTEGRKRAPAVTTVILHLCLMAPYVNLDGIVHRHVSPLLHHGGKIYLLAAMQARLSGHACSGQQKYQRLSIAAIFMDVYGVFWI